MIKQRATQFARDVYTLNCAGFAIIPGFIENNMLSELENTAISFLKEIEDFGELPYKAGWPLRNARCLYAVAPVFQSLVMETPLLDYAQSYLGDCRLRDCHLLVNSPDPRNAVRGRKADVNWHRDKEWTTEEKIAPAYLHCFVLLTDMTRDNGGTLVVPGTHRMREPDYYFLHSDPGNKTEENYYPVYPQRYFPAAIQVEAPRGSLVLIDPMAIHAQGINVTTEPRMVINATFHRGDLRALMNCRGIAAKSARYELSPQFLDILGSGDDLTSAYGPLSG